VSDYRRLPIDRPIDDDNPFPAGSLNRAFDTLDRLSGSRSAAGSTSDPEQIEQLAVNLTSTALAPGQALAVTGLAGGLPASSAWPLVSPRPPLVTLGALAADSLPAVAVGPIGASGGVGQVTTAPLAIVKVSIGSTSHTRAKAVSGGIESAEAGPLRIIEKGGSSGVQWCLVAWEGTGGGSTTGRGVIAEGARAQWINASRVLRTDGVIKAWPFTAPPFWTDDSKYAIGDVVRLTAPPWSDAATYTVGQLVRYAGTVYQCIVATGPDATFPISKFASRSLDGQWLRATATSSGTAASPATFDVSKWAAEDALLWLDRYDLTGANAPTNFDTGTNYTAGKVALLTGTAWSSGTTYSIADIVSNSGNVYRCTTATGPDATFPSEDFTLIGATGTIWRAKVDTGTGAFDYREWRPVTPVVELRHGLTYKDVTVGSYVAWIGSEAVVMHCEAVEGWA
jgi:hypothetical protein